mgnify:CR=1 FL=1
MLNNTSSKIERIGKFIKENDEKSLKILLLFKMLKSELNYKIEDEYEDEGIDINKDEMNEVCLKVAKKIVNEGREKPTVSDIEDLLKKLKI